MIFEGSLCEDSITFLYPVSSQMRPTIYTTNDTVFLLYNQGADGEWSYFCFLIKSEDS